MTIVKRQAIISVAKDVERFRCRWQDHKVVQLLWTIGCQFLEMLNVTTPLLGVYPREIETDVPTKLVLKC